MCRYPCFDKDEPYMAQEGRFIIKKLKPNLDSITKMDNGQIKFERLQLKL